MLLNQTVADPFETPGREGLTRRALLVTGLAIGAAAMTGCRSPQSARLVPAQSASVSPPAPGRTLPAGIEERLVSTLTRFLAPTQENPDRPTYAGAVALILLDGAVAAHVAVGDALRYGAGPVELPPARRVPMRTDSIFDLASITKVYTAILTLQLVDRGLIGLDAPVADHLPAFGRPQLTPALLLAHTSGLPDGTRVSGLADDAARRAAVLATPLVDGADPGTAFRYSSVGLMVLGQLVEAVTGLRLDEALKTNLLAPMGLRETGFTPATWLSTEDIAARVAATDARSSRGLLRGVVHDDVADTLGGIAGHAGIFSTAVEVAAVGQMLLDGGTYRGARLLSSTIVERMLVNANPGLTAIDPDRPGRSADHGLGVELNQPWFMGRLAAARTFGHTGFTGTSLLVDPGRRLVLVVLTNRAHPNWSWANPDPMRAAVADLLTST